MYTKLLQAPQRRRERLATDLYPERIQRVLSKIIQEDFRGKARERQHEAQRHEGERQLQAAGAVLSQQCINEGKQRRIARAAENASYQARYNCLTGMLQKKLYNFHLTPTASRRILCSHFRRSNLLRILIHPSAQSWGPLSSHAERGCSWQSAQLFPAARSQPTWLPDRCSKAQRAWRKTRD